MKRLAYISRLLVASLTVLLFGMLTSCNDDDSSTPPVGGGNIWTYIPLSTHYQVPQVPGRQESGLLKMRVSGDTLYYEIFVNGLSGDDELTMAHFHTGDVLTNGPIVFDFEPAFSGGTAVGFIPIRHSLADSLKNGSEIYFNVHSTQAATGLVRGQVNTSIALAADVVLTGEEQVPAVTTTATGTAILRVTSDGRLFSNVTVNNLEGSDALSMAHIHLGDMGDNGDIIVMLCETAADFGVVKSQFIDNETLITLLSNPIYVNVHSTTYPDGVIRGQVIALIDPNFVPNPDPGTEEPGTDPAPGDPGY